MTLGNDWTIHSITTRIKPNSSLLCLSCCCDAFVLVFLHLFPGSIWAETISVVIAALFLPVTQRRPWWWCCRLCEMNWRWLRIREKRGRLKGKVLWEMMMSLQKGQAMRADVFVNDSHSTRLWFLWADPIPVYIPATFPLLLSLLSFCWAGISFYWL